MTTPRPPATAPLPAPPVSGGPFPDLGRSYATRWIPDEELDLTLAPETVEEDNGEIVPMSLEARRKIARFRMEMREEAERDARLGGV